MIVAFILFVEIYKNISVANLFLSSKYNLYIVIMTKRQESKMVKIFESTKSKSSLSNPFRPFSVNAPNDL